MLEFVGLSSGIQGCFLCVSFGELRGESVGKIFLEGEDAEVDCTPKKATINKVRLTCRNIIYKMPILSITDVLRAALPS